jgi:hypothetical protein
MRCTAVLLLSRFASSLLVTCTHHAPVHHRTPAGLNKIHYCCMETLREDKLTEELVTSDHFLDLGRSTSC